MANVTVKKFKRTVDPQGTDAGAAKEIEELAMRKKVLAGLEPAAPKLGNPARQIGGLARAVAQRLKPRTEMTPAENQTAKLKGQRAFYEGKLERARKNSTGNALSPTTIQDEGR